MRVLVTGDIRTSPVLLESGEATALLISNDKGDPVVIYQFADRGYIRFTKGEDPEFDEVKQSLGL